MTYDDLYSIGRAESPESEALLHRVQVACYVAADKIRVEDPGTADHVRRLTWARTVYSKTADVAYTMFRALLAANRAFTTTQVLSSTDATIQAKVDEMVAAFLE